MVPGMHTLKVQLVDARGASSLPINVDVLVTEASSEDNGGGSDPCASTECGSHGVCDNGACACYDGFFGTRVGPRDCLGWPDVWEESK